MSLVLNVEILGEFKDLTRATKGSENELTQLNKKINGFSNSAKAAFASIGVGLSFAFIARELKDATKAAVEDTQSQALLAKQLQNTTNATDDQIKSVEKQISKWQSMAAVADDEIRPAYASLVRSTKDTTEASKLMALALDVSAGTGKSLESVSLALGKAINGSETALIKLVPSIKNAKDPMGELEKQFAGAAEAAADTDPYARMQVIFGELQEQIGMALLPKLLEFSKWLATPEGTAKLQDITDGIVDILTALVGVVDWVQDNADWLGPLVVGIGAVTAAWQVSRLAILGVQAAIGLATAAQLAFNAASNAPQGLGKVGAVGTAVGLLGTTAAVLSLGGDVAKPGTSGSPYLPKTTSTARTPLANQLAPKNVLPTLKPSVTNVVVNVKQPVTSSTIIQTVKEFQKSTGSTLSQVLR